MANRGCLQGGRIITRVLFCIFYLRFVHPSTRPAYDVAPLRQLQSEFLKEWLDQWGENALRKSQSEVNLWADDVREAMNHTWRGYQAMAWGDDEIHPISGKTKNWCKLGVTLIEALSTLYLMGFKDEFDVAAKWVEKNALPSPGPHSMHSAFEINIRVFGGLLSAYSLSGYRTFLETAQRVGDKLLSSYDNSTGFPRPQVDIGTGKGAGSSTLILAEVGTVQMEMRYLSNITKNPKYRRASEKALKAIWKIGHYKGLMPNQFDARGKFIANEFSMGGKGDSYYEYLIKTYILTGKKDEKLKRMWIQSMREMMSQMVRRTDSGRTFIAELHRGTTRNAMDHLACYVPGMLMLGARNLPKEDVDPQWEQVAEEITETCYYFSKTPSGLAPENVRFDMHAQAPQDMKVEVAGNILRPEAIESIYYMWYYTGNPKYRTWGREMWTAFQKHSRAKYGYAAVRDVGREKPQQYDVQESFWLAETLKYFFLLFSPRDTFNHEEFIFTTEAHPFRVFEDIPAA